MDKGDSFIHVKLDYGEVVKSKKDILASEIDLINIMKSAARYSFLRQEELELKAQFYKEIKKITMGLKLLEATFPHIRVPKFLAPETEGQKPVSKSAQKMISGTTDTGLEEQLREIQRKLRSIS